MAKMFYTLEEAKAALGRSEEEIKQFAREVESADEDIDRSVGRPDVNPITRVDLVEQPEIEPATATVHRRLIDGVL